MRRKARYARKGTNVARR